jgi:hypothetical protein
MGSGGIASSFLTLALDGSECSASRPGRFTPVERSPVPIGQEARWFPELVWALWNGEETVGRDGTRTPTAQSAARLYTGSNTIRYKYIGFG